MKKTVFQLTCIFFFFMVFINCTGPAQKGAWIGIFNGENLDDFEQKGGAAKYDLVEGTIVGTTVPNTPNSFLCTKKLYDNFILELEVLVDTALNSGIQIRSHEYQDGRVHGYQVDIDPSPRAYSGGIYDEARRGWLYDLAENEEGRTAFINGEWNKYRIEAIDNSIKTWINGVMCANLLDEADDSGFIALQVHTVNVKSKPWTDGVQVKWRNIKIMTEDLEKYRIVNEQEIPLKAVLVNNQLTEAEQQDGWELLFDGKTPENWKGAYKDTFPGFGWIIENGTLTVEPSGGEESANGGDIVTMDTYSDFDLMVDFKLTPGANSGIKYYVTEIEKAEGSAIGLEYQILDDNLHPDAQMGRDGNRTVASLYDLIPARNKHVRQIGEWNMARIISKDNHVEHWLNGSKVLEYERGSKEYRDLVALSKYKKWKNFGEAESGHILLQDHGDKVSFRNIKIKEL